MSLVAPRLLLGWAWCCALGLAPACLDWSKLETGSCGDAFVGREEACDDGNRIAGDGCSDSCKIEPPFCGDGRVDPGEACDDANGLDDDACVAGCRLARCGDGYVWELEEECDDEAEVDGDGCSHECKLETLPVGPRCGDGKVDADEACDDGNDSDNDGCLRGCSWATCGDGRARSGVEECDSADSGCTRGCLSCSGPGTFFRGGNAHCYTVHAEPVTQEQARASCQSEGGDLWTATSQPEAGDVVTKLALAGSYWLGLSTTALASGWVTGEGTKYTNFAPGEPSDRELRCVSFDASAGGVWRSQACATPLGFVCERAPAFVSPLDHHAYRLRTAALPAASARRRCVEEGAKLSSLETEDERIFVGKQSGLVTWLDATDSAQEGRFVWASGLPVDAAAFAPGQPDDSDGSQACLVQNAGDRWADADCADSHPFVCEIE